MWYWQVIFEDDCGNLHEIFSKTGFDRQSDAETSLQAHEKAINELLQKMHSVLILDEAVIYRSKR